MKRLTLLAALFALAACKGDGTGSPTVTAVTITPGSPSVAVGGTVQLAAVASMSSGGPITTGFSWSSLDGAIATVSGTGLVTGAAAGIARITAAYGNRADTIEVTVTPPALVCGAGNSLNLAVGQTAALTGAEAAAICVSGGAAGAEYAIVPQFASSAQSTSVSLGVQVSGNTVPVVGPPNPSRTPSSALLAGGQVPDEGFHVALRERTAAAMVGHVPGAQAWNRARRTISRNLMADPPAIGTLLQLNVSQEFCTNADYRVGKVIAISDRAIIVEDTANPKPSGISLGDYEHIAATFDTLIYPLAVATFGEPQDIDSNSRVTIFYTRAVNELTPPNSGGYVGGFFHGRDLFPKAAGGGFPACAGSNAAEMFYMLASDPAGAVNNNPRSADLVRRTTLSTVGHEFQHLISASRRLYVHNASGTDWSEDAWLNEGLSHITEELLYYHAAGLGPRSNISYAELLSTPQRDAAYTRFLSQNIGRLRFYLQSVESNGVYDDDDDLETRGAAWAFLRYAADRRNGNDQQLWYALVNNTSVGIPNLSARLGVPTTQWVRDFNLAMYADDAVPVAPQFTNPSWNFRSLYNGLASSQPYPLQVRSLTAGSSINFSVAAGTAGYLRMGVAANGFGGVAVSSGGGTPPTTVAVTVLRTR